MDNEYIKLYELKFQHPQSLLHASKTHNAQDHVSILYTYKILSS